jgi:hypothetical protein
VTVVATAAGCALALAGCGFTGNSSASTSGDSDLALQFANCMRAHGVPNFPDPGSGGGPKIGPGSGIDPSSPAFQFAQSKCNKLLPGGGPSAAPAPTAAELHTALAWARCVRKHGMPNFPDPSSTAHAGLFFRAVVFPVGPEFNVQAPGFKEAQATCGRGPLAGKG